MGIVERCQTEADKADFAVSLICSFSLSISKPDLHFLMKLYLSLLLTEAVPLCLEGDFPKIVSITGGFLHYYYYYIRSSSVSPFSFSFMQTFIINKHFPSYQPPLIEDRQDCIYQRDMEWLKTLFNLEEEAERFGHRLDSGKPGESTAVSLEDTEDSKTALESDENQRDHGKKSSSLFGFFDFEAQISR